MFLAQRRKVAKKTLRNAVALCAFAPLREKSSRIHILFGLLRRLKTNFWGKALRDDGEGSNLNPTAAGFCHDKVERKCCFTARQMGKDLRCHHFVTNS
jgi:hypothetical protein